MIHTLTRRGFLQLTAAAGAALALEETGAQITRPPASELKRTAMQNGKIVGCYIVAHDLLSPQNATELASNFALVADGNDLKFSNRLRPTPDTFDFSYGDKVVTWAHANNLLFRGHCLIWWNGLPNWFAGYVNAGNAQNVLENHISTVVKHYAGQIYSWDVINEPLHNDGRPDMLRIKPWVSLLGPNYIDMAFHVARQSDPKARLVLNECYFEHATPAEVARRDALLALLTRLKASNVPFTTLGIQAHLRGAVALDGPGLTLFMQKVRDLGIEMMITELDVDDIDVPGPQIAGVVAGKYQQFLDLVLPFVKVITLEGFRNEPNAPLRADGAAHMMNIFDANYSPTPAYQAVMQQLRSKR